MLQSLSGDKDGSALVEGAVLVPLLFVLLFGVYEFSWFFYQQHLVSTGVRDAARYLARVIDSCNAFSPAWAIEQYQRSRVRMASFVSSCPTSTASIPPFCTPPSASPQPNFSA